MPYPDGQRALETDQHGLEQLDLQVACQSLELQRRIPSSTCQARPVPRSWRYAEHSRWTASPTGWRCVDAAAGYSWFAGSPCRRQGRGLEESVGGGCPGRAGMGGASQCRGVVGWGVGWGEAGWGPSVGVRGLWSSPAGEVGGGGWVVGDGEGDTPSSTHDWSR